MARIVVAEMAKENRDSVYLVCTNPSKGRLIVRQQNGFLGEEWPIVLAFLPFHRTA
jgi:hypothetical protein